MTEDSANTAGRINITEEEVTCKLCSKFYSSPKLVECLHSFCQSCIQQHLVKEGKEHIFVCPKCLHVTKTGDSSAASLTSDLHVPRLLEVFRCHTKSVTPCTICTLEGNVGEATNRCLSCNDHLCTACSKKHTFSSLTAKHRVVSLVDLRSGKYDEDIMRKQTLLCKEHDQQDCEFFCNTCSGPQCTKCILTKHMDHSYVDIKDAAAKKKSELLSLLQDCTDPYPERSEVAVAQAELDLLQKEENLFVKTVNEQTELIIKRIKQQSQECLQRATEMFKEERKRRQLKNDVALKRSEIRKNILHLCRTLRYNGGSEIVEMLEALKKGVLLIKSEVCSNDAKETMTTYKASITYPLDEKYFDVIKVDMAECPKQRAALSAIEDNIPGSDADKPKTQGVNVKQHLPSEELRAQTALENNRETAILKKKDKAKPFAHPGTDATMDQELQLKSTFSAEIQSDCYVTGISAMVLRSTEQCYILDNMNARLKEFKLCGKKKCFINLSGKCKPFDKFIHLQSNDKMFIITVYKKVLYIFKTIGWNISKVYSNEIISKDDMKVEPLVANFAEDFLVGNLPKNYMKVYNCSGDLLRSWESQMKRPFEFLKYAEGDKLISSNWVGKGSVSLESEKNGLLVKIPGCKRFGLPWRPADGVLDKKGHIIVSDPNRNEISVFSTDGSQLFFYDTYADAVVQPNCLLVDKVGLIYVSYKDGMVAVYMNKRC